jgi:diadenosine tetraphosphate (Ap4A) HIT family hydrolase
MTGHEVLLSDGTWYARHDRHPVTPGHLLVILVRHCNEFSDLSAEESGRLLPFIRECREFIDARFHPLGYNIGTNIGIVAGQSVRHIHIHIIPRYTGDTPDPRGGIRAVVPKNALHPFTDGISTITGIPDAVCVEESFADLTESTAMEKLLDEHASEARLITDIHDAPLALALKTNEGWRITSGLLNNKGRLLQAQFSASGFRTCQTTRDLWMRALKEYYSRRIISTVGPVPEMNQAGRPGLLAGLLEDIFHGQAGASCLDCCCGPGTGSVVIRSFGLKPVSYDNMPAQLALGFLRGRLREDETCCIDATVASRYLEPVEYGLGLMLGDINSTNTGIWEQITKELLSLSGSTVITVVTEREARRVDRWCREAGRDTTVFENPRHPFLDRWVCSAEPRH